MKRVLAFVIMLVLIAIAVTTLVACGGLSGEYESTGSGKVTALSFEGDKVTMTCSDGSKVDATFETSPGFITFVFASDEDAKKTGFKSNSSCLFVEEDDYIKIDLIKYNKK